VFAATLLLELADIMTRDPELGVEWLTEIELPGDHPTVLFREGLSYEEILSLAAELRTSFLLFCNCTPELASQYLKSFENREHREEAITTQPLPASQLPLFPTSTCPSWQREKQQVVLALVIAFLMIVHLIVM
jgi:hypothetical protein